MDEETRKQKWKTETDEIYRAIGEFVVKFERVCFSMSLSVIAILQRAGIEDQQVCNILVANLTADPLRGLFESLAAQTKWLKVKDQNELKKLLTRVQKLTAERNDVVHSAWLIDWSNHSSLEKDFSTAFGMKYHKNKNGIATKDYKRDATYFRQLIEEAESLSQALDKLQGRFIFDEHGNQMAFKNNAKNDSDA